MAQATAREEALKQLYRVCNVIQTLARDGEPRILRVLDYKNFCLAIVLQFVLQAPSFFLMLSEACWTR